MARVLKKCVHAPVQAPVTALRPVTSQYAPAVHTLAALAVAGQKFPAGHNDAVGVVELAAQKYDGAHVPGGHQQKRKECASETACTLTRHRHQKFDDFLFV